MEKEKIRRKVLKKQPRRPKSLPRGNVRFTGNEAGRRERERRPVNGQVVMGDGLGGTGYVLPVAGGTSVTAMDQQAGRRPGTGRKGIPWHLPPEGPPYPN